MEVVTHSMKGAGSASQRRRRLGRRVRSAMLTTGAFAFGITQCQARIIDITAISVKPAENPGPIAYELVTGEAFGELDPTTPDNRVITDLQLAPRNAAGLVQYSVRFVIARPVDPAKGTGILDYEVVNRGKPLLTKDWGGNIFMWSGWQGDIVQTPDNVTVTVPIAHGSGGEVITGPMLARFADVPPGTRSLPLSVLGWGTRIPYDAASLDPAAARLISKQGETRTGASTGIRRIGPDAFAFGDCTSTPFPGRPDPRSLCLRSGFDPGLLYELRYQVKNPLVLGIGPAAIRDLVSFVRHDRTDRNPIAGKVEHAIATGVSQSGNLLKSYLLLGFNGDENGRIVFDGIDTHIGGRLQAINIRFAIPSGSATLYEPGSEGVLWWSTYRDDVRGLPAGSLLQTCALNNTCPKIFETFGGAELTGRQMTIAMTGTAEDRDLPLPENVRRYYFPGAQHGGAPATSFDPMPRQDKMCVMAPSPISEAEPMRALHRALVDWVVTGKEPPPSEYPMLSKGQLVRADPVAMGLPSVPGMPNPAGLGFGFVDYDYGPQLDKSRLSGVVDAVPPKIRRVIPILMPKVDADGNEISGARSVLHQAPLGTYTGWNATAKGFFKGQACNGGLAGGYVPFATTAADRATNRDPRPSLEERYGTNRGYTCRVRAVIRAEIVRGFLLPEDGVKLAEMVGKTNILPSENASQENLAKARALCRS